MISYPLLYHIVDHLSCVCTRRVGCSATGGSKPGGIIREDRFVTEADVGNGGVPLSKEFQKVGCPTIGNQDFEAVDGEDGPAGETGVENGRVPL